MTDSYAPPLAASPPPVYAGIRAYPWDGSRSFYNVKSSNTRKLRAALSLANSGAGFAEIIAVGDSKTNGFGPGPHSAWPYRAALASGVALAGAGFSQLGSSFGVADSRLAFTGSWTAGAANGSAQTSTAASTVTYTSLEPGTVVEIAYYNLTPGQFSYQIDGAAAVNVNPNGTFTIGRLVVPGQTNAVHAVKINYISGTIFIVGISVRQATGLAINNVAITGTTSANWNANAFPQLLWGAFQETPTPAAVIVSLGTNDLAVGGQTPSQSQAALAGIVAICQSYGNPDVFLLVETAWNNLSPQAAIPYLQAQYAVADQYNIGLIDCYDQFGGVAAGVANGLIGGDQLHETAAGQDALGRIVAELLR